MPKRIAAVREKGGADSQRASVGDSSDRKQNDVRCPATRQEAWPFQWVFNTKSLRYVALLRFASLHESLRFEEGRHGRVPNPKAQHHDR